MFKIKICGITSAEDARSAVDAGADAIGLNFYTRSRRHVSPDVAPTIAAALPAATSRVGVFVNASAPEVAAIAADVGLHAVQLHGDEPADLLAQIPLKLSIVRAFRCDVRGLAPLADYLEACRGSGRLPDAVLIDADATDGYGGTGRVADWEQIALERELIGEIPLILAGGLTPANVADAIDAVRPDGVDVASGVESTPGRKDRALVEQFVAAAREAFVRYS